MRGSRMLRKKRVLIPDGEFNHVLKVVRALGRTGWWEVHLCTSDPSTHVRFSRFVKRVHSVDDFEPDQRVDQVVDIAREIDADIILPVGEDAVRAFAELRDRVPAECVLAPVPDVGSFDVAVDKGRLAALLDEFGLPTPTTLTASELITGRADSGRLAWPVLCKPVRGSFGRGMERADSLDELLDHLGTLHDPEGYIVQDMEHGRDVDVSVLCRNGVILASTLQEASIPAPSGSYEPATVVRFTRDESVEEIVAALMRRLDWTGVAHVDLRKHPLTGRVYILEINARFWGSLLGSVTARVNIPHLACLEALGYRLPEPEYREGHFFTRGITGRLPDGSSIPWSWRRSHLPYVLVDPLPELVDRLGS